MLKKNNMTEQEHCDAMWNWLKVFLSFCAHL